MPTVGQDLLGLITPADIVIVLIVVNFFTFAAFGIDKTNAERGRWRIRESTLLTLAVLGGTPSAYAGRYAFRHKTRKQPFNLHLAVIAAAQTALVMWVAMENL